MSSSTDDLTEKKYKFVNLKSTVTKTTLKAIKNMGLKYMTPIQAETIPKALDGCDIVATAKTGSGKTLAFLVPVLEKVKLQMEHGIYGTFCIIISPTRELAIQTFNLLQYLDHHQNNVTTVLLIGGENRIIQAKELSKGAHIIVSTPGRLLDFMKSRKFNYKHVCCLVLDEADKILQHGFEEDLNQIIKLLPKNRQTMLFSATQSEKVFSLAKTAMKESIEFINTTADSLMATVKGLKHGYVICRTEERLWCLFKILKKTRKQKVMVFFSSCKSVEFHYVFFRSHCNASVKCIHGKLNQEERTATINEFYKVEKGTLFCTDVAARGLDIPAVDLIVQYDPPGDTSEYIHRVGRTARGLDGVGNAVLVLRPEEQEFLEHLNRAKVYLEPYTISDDLDNYQYMLENIVETDPEFKKLAEEAYEGYIKAFGVRKLKNVFNVITLDLDTLARSFGLKNIPNIDIRVGFKKKHRDRKRKATSCQGTSKHEKCSKL